MSVFYLLFFNSPCMPGPGVDVNGCMLARSASRTPFRVVQLCPPPAEATFTKDIIA